MKSRVLLVIAAAIVLAGATALAAGDPGRLAAKEDSVLKAGSPPPLLRAELKLQIFEGIRDAAAPSTKVVTSSFLKFINYFSVPSEEAVEQQVRQIYNLKDARLVSEANLSLGTGKTPDKAFHIFRLDGRAYLILVTAGKLAEPNQFHLEVYEQGEKDFQANLLDMEFNIQPAKTVVLGFEDTSEKPYFMAFSSLPVAARAAGGGEMAPPKLLKSVDPIYPEQARKAGVEGAVILEATTDVYGRVASIKVLRSIPILDQAAVDALKQWVYEPAVINGQPKQVTFTVTVRFRLDSKDKTGELVGGVVGGVLGGVPKGVEGGVKGGVEGAVKGGVEGGVEGGVKGGVESGVKGGAEGQVAEGPDKDAVRAINEIKPPKLVKSVDPVYPEKARQAQVEGVVILEAHADEKGNVVSVRILRSIPVLDQAAVDAVKQWKYEPLILEGKARKAIFTVTVRFMLKSGDKEKDLEKFAQGAVKAEGEIAPPRLVKAVDPVYPEEARQARVQGVVILSVKTDADGHVVDAIVLRSIPQLNKAAIDAVKQWVYEPLIIDGVAKSVVFTVTVRFQLNGKDEPGKTASVLGLVNKPGHYELASGNETLLQMISLAGGISDQSADQAVINREKDGVYIHLFIKLKDVIGGRSKNVAVLPGDVINISAGGDKKDAVPVRPGDSLGIAVKELPDLDQTVRVSDTGLIELKVLGKMDVGGETTGGLEQRIASLLVSKYLKAARVTVTVVQKGRN
jgi:TonB family protein